MADNALQTGSDTIRTKDRAGVETQIFGIDVGIGTGTEALMSATNPMPVVNRVAPLSVTAGSITTSSSTVTATTDITNAGTVTVVIGGTYAGVNAAFEASVDGSLWVPLMGQRTDSGVVETTSGVLPANQLRAWDFPLPGFQQFRVRATAWTSGTAAIAIAPAVNAFEIAPTTIPAGAATPTVAGVAASASSVTLLAANQARRGATIQNDVTSGTLYLRLGAVAAATTSGNHTVMIAPGNYYEAPANYTGEIRGIWSAATGFANVTEVVT